MRFIYKRLKEKIEQELSIPDIRIHLRLFIQEGNIVMAADTMAYLVMLEKIVEKRLRTKLDDPKWFEGISDKQIRTEVRIGYLQYDKEKYNRNANEFKDDVEEEVSYDI